MSKINNYFIDHAIFSSYITGPMANTKSAIKTVKVVKESEVSYETIESDVESKGLLNKDIKSSATTSAKNVAIDSNLGEVNKKILSYSTEEISSLRGVSKKATEYARDVLKYAEKEYKKDINKLDENQKKTLMRDYINDYFGFEIISKRTNQRIEPSQLIKHFNGDRTKTGYAMRELTTIIRYLKEHFHLSGGIKEIIGYDLMDPNFGKGGRLNIIKGWQADSIAQRELTIRGGVDGLINLQQWVKNKFENYTTKSGFKKEFTKDDISLLLEVGIKGKLRDKEPENLTLKDINLELGTIEVIAPGKKIRTASVGKELAQKLHDYATEKGLKPTEKIFVKETTELNELFREIYRQADTKGRGTLVPMIKDLFSGEIVEYWSGKKTPEVKVGKLTLGGELYNSQRGLGASTILRRLFGEKEAGVDLGHAAGMKSPARKSYKKAGDAPPLETTADYSKMKASDLSAELKDRGLPSSGSKKVLIERLKANDKSLEPKVEKADKGLSEKEQADFDKLGETLRRLKEELKLVKEKPKDWVPEGKIESKKEVSL